jgi:hypothetical protein
MHLRGLALIMKLQFNIKLLWSTITQIYNIYTGFLCLYINTYVTNVRNVTQNLKHEKADTNAPTYDTQFPVCSTMSIFDVFIRTSRCGVSWRSVLMSVGAVRQVLRKNAVPTAFHSSRCSLSLPGTLGCYVTLPLDSVWHLHHVIMWFLLITSHFKWWAGRVSSCVKGDASLCDDR